jgi:hypothetical protein
MIRSGRPQKKPEKVESFCRAIPQSVVKAE